jgi:histidinol-phosphatase
MDADLALALELADTADAITMRHFRSVDLRVESKPDTTPVTEADRSVERAIRERLAAVRPGDAVVGEEYGARGSGDRRWIVDPVDGTKNFVRGVPVWATLIALQDRGDGLVGVVSAPALHRRWWAARGHGAFADGIPIGVSKVAALGNAHFSYSSLTGWAAQRRLAGFLELADTVWRTRGFGDFWSHMLVAEGGADIAAEPEVSLWDLAALQVVVEEAGGRFTDLAGQPTCDGGSAVSSNGLLHDDVLRLLAPRPSTRESS